MTPPDSDEAPPCLGHGNLWAALGPAWLLGHWKGPASVRDQKRWKAAAARH